jgi:tRNA A-37 threonylcarbamoyl transferase component Bud32
MLPVHLRLYVMLKEVTEKYCYVEREIQYWEKNKDLLLRLGRQGYRTKIEDIGLGQEGLQSLRKCRTPSQEATIAEIDRDGFLLSHVGPIRNAPTIPKEQFVPRTRSSLKVVHANGYVGVKKDYKGNKMSFVNELRALHMLGLAGCHVPSIMNIDFSNLTLLYSYISGSVLLEELAKLGAVVRNRDVDSHPDFVRLRRKQKWLRRIQEGRRSLHKVIDSQFVESLFAQLNIVHACGFLWNDIKYGNIVIEKRSGQPYLIDFEYSRYYPNLGEKYFRILCDRDMKWLHLHFDAEELSQERTSEKAKDGRAIGT